jgi:hypothetical protein
LPKEGGLDKETLLNSIRDTLQNDTVNYPKWIALQKTAKLGKFASSSTDLKVFLRHVTFPGVLQSYHDLHLELSGSAIETDGEIEGSRKPIVPMDIVPVSSKGGVNENAVRDFFQGISNANPGMYCYESPHTRPDKLRVDGLVGLCKLADIHHRINRAAEHDCHQVASWLENEQTRGSTSQRSLEERQGKLKLLSERDQQSTLEVSFGGLKTELGVLNDALVRAEEEEELAKKVTHL